MSFTTLISASELATHIADANWVLLDCRHDLAQPMAGREGYASGHLPGAQFADLDHQLSDKSPGPEGEFRGRHPLPTPEQFIATLRAWGVNDDSQVIAYDAQGGMFAARLWWMLRWVGQAAVAVLDGGLPAWNAAGLPLTTEVQERSPGRIMARPSLVTTVSAQDLLGQHARTIVDARAPDRFRGENETLDPVGGHIPGAKNRFFKENLAASGQFKPAAELHAAFSALIQDPSQTVMQCGSGVTACHNLLALEVAGLRGAALYPGSWSEWCSDPARPVER
jgi:thiosulfate/3-mercaptopyruvate sulfurtransferase